MKLYCVRHGEAKSNLTQPEQSLTENGQNEVRNVAHCLYNHQIKIDQIIHSPKLRAKQTADIFSDIMKPTHIKKCTHLGEENNIIALVKMILTYEKDTMLVGHLPFMPQLISQLVINNKNTYPLVNYPPAGTVCLEKYNEDRWIIQWILNPALV